MQADAPLGDPSLRIKQREVVAMIDEALGVALAGRAQIRPPFEQPHSGHRVRR